MLIAGWFVPTPVACPSGFPKRSRSIVWNVYTFSLLHNKCSQKASTQCNLYYFTVRQHMKGFSMKVISTIGDDEIRQSSSDAAILSRVFEHFILFHCVPTIFSRKTSTQCNLCYFTVTQQMKGFSMKVMTGQKRRDFQWNFCLWFSHPVQIILLFDYFDSLAKIIKGKGGDIARSK